MFNTKKSEEVLKRTIAACKTIISHPEIITQEDINSEPENGGTVNGYMKGVKSLIVECEKSLNNRWSLIIWPTEYWETRVTRPAEEVAGRVKNA